MNGALLSRFDLVFILLDRPDEHMDKFLSDHIMRLHSGEKTETKTPFKFLSNLHPVAPKSSATIHTQNARISLAERLELNEGETIDHLPLSLLRKYIAYARTYTKPRYFI